MEPTPRRPRVAYLCPEPPYPRDSGGRFRVDLLRRALAACADVTLVVVGDRPPRDVRLRLRAEGARVFPPRRETPAGRALRCARAVLLGRCIPAARYLSRRRVARLVAHVRSLAPDLVVVGDAYLTAFLPALRALGVPAAIDTHDAASVVHARIAAAARGPLERLAYRVLSANTARVERELFPLADEVWTLTPEDAAFYRERVGLRRVEVLPNAIELLAPPPDAAREPRAVVFTGSFSYWPNEDAALRLVELAAPLHASGALERLYLVGIAPTARMREAAARLPFVTVTGRVPEVGPWLARAAVVAAPLAAGSGMKVKLLEAMAAARPIVTTPVGAEGLALAPGVHAEVVSLDRFPDALAALLGDPDRQAALGRAGRAWVEARFSVPALERAVAARVRALTAGRERALA